jgi:hypothetical protein
MAGGFTQYLEEPQVLVLDFGSMLGAQGPSGYGSANSLWPTANKAFYHPLNFRTSTVVNRINLWINTQNASQHLDVGLYNAAGTYLISSGSTTIGAAGIQTFTITSTLVPKGLNYLGISCDTTSTFRLTGYTVPGGANGFIHVMGIFEEASAFPLPTTSMSMATSSTFNFQPIVTIWSTDLP